MYCKNCKVKVDGATDTCPLCHTPLEGEREITRAFPYPKAKSDIKKVVVLMTLLSAIFVTLIAIIVNIFVVKEYAWSVIVLILSGYIFCFIRYDLFVQTNFRLSIFVELVSLTVVFYVIKLVFVHTDHWVFSYILPVIYFLTQSVFYIYVAIKHKFATKNLVTAILISTMGIIPLISAYIFGLQLLPSIVVAVESLVAIIVSLILGRKELINEIIKFFHR